MAPTLTVLAQDLVVGDVLVDAGLGGGFDAAVTSLRVGPTHVTVALGSQRIVLGMYEACVVRRRGAA